MPTRFLRTVATAIFVFGITTSTAAAETRIAFVNPGLKDEFFWPEVTRTMQAAADQFGYTLDVVYAERDAQRMIDLGLEQVARTNPPDVLILVNEFQAAPEIVRAADAKGIKTFMLLNTFVGEQSRNMGAPGEKYRHWIGSLVPSNRGAGQRMATTLVECMVDTARTDAAGKFHVLSLTGDARTPASQQRTAGMRAGFATADDVVIDRLFHTNWQAPDARRLTLNYLDWAKKHNVAPAGIWAANDALAHGAIEALRERGLAPGQDVCIVGLNWSPDAVTLVEDGIMAGTDGGHFLAGGWAMVMVNDYLQQADMTAGGDKPLGSVIFEMAGIDRYNVGQFLTELGDRDWRRIPFHRFARTESGYDFSLARILAYLGE
jgi:ABC-type sugar transport system substrate-binding protein